MGAIHNSYSTFGTHGRVPNVLRLLRLRALVKKQPSRIIIAYSV
nr:MAG TPA: hypothetical protein [Caudoviricetes sp.]